MDTCQFEILAVLFLQTLLWEGIVQLRDMRGVQGGYKGGTRGV